jgi:hypothetical protein
VEIILGQAGRRWSEDEKRALVAETFVDGQRRHNILVEACCILAASFLKT